ncbi:hypothetical protein PR048_006646 [Dryococelus australis]|uniref:Uncharacterized protein n=1 Tax=Dryococelus australis TaxID=614101 RepID=A0ABQ9ICI1_9NEOP|nr:hypothetical protein PR048_006646 [Dryococelus australis]
MQGRGKREFPEKTHRPPASSGTINHMRKSRSDIGGNRTRLTTFERQSHSRYKWRVWFYLSDSRRGDVASGSTQRRPTAMPNSKSVTPALSTRITVPIAECAPAQVAGSPCRQGCCVALTRGWRSPVNKGGEPTKQVITRAPAGGREHAETTPSRPRSRKPRITLSNYGTVCRSQLINSPPRQGTVFLLAEVLQHPFLALTPILTSNSAVYPGSYRDTALLRRYLSICIYFATHDYRKCPTVMRSVTVHMTWRVYAVQLVVSVLSCGIGRTGCCYTRMPLYIVLCLPKRNWQGNKQGWEMPGAKLVASGVRGHQYQMTVSSRDLSAVTGEGVMHSPLCALRWLQGACSSLHCRRLPAHVEPHSCTSLYTDHELSWTTPLAGGFSRESPVSPFLHFDAAPYSPHFLLIGFQDLNVRIRPNKSLISTLIQNSWSCDSSRRFDVRNIW